MILSAIAAGLSAASALYGAISSSKSNAQARQTLEDEHNRQQAWYNRQYNSDYTNRTDFQSILSKQRDLLNEQYRNARGIAKVGGGTDESVALTKMANNQSLTDTMSNIAENASAYKDNISNMQQAESNQYAHNLANLQSSQAQQTANAMGQVGNAMGQIAGSDKSTWKQDWSWLTSKKKQNGTTSPTETYYA